MIITAIRRRNTEQMAMMWQIHKLIQRENLNFFINSHGLNLGAGDGSCRHMAGHERSNPFEG